MDKPSAEPLTKSRLLYMRKKWSRPDSKKGAIWEFDGVTYPIDNPTGYNFEMREGLASLKCNTFDSLVVFLNKKLKRKANVIDLMGGAYFLHNPENTNTLIGIRVHDKDEDFLESSNIKDSEKSRLTQKIISAPNRHVIEADLLTNSGWDKIKNSKLPKSDLLVCRPVGPFDNKQAMTDIADEPKSYIGLYKSLFWRMTELVNKNNGIIFTEIPDIYEDNDIQEFFKEVDKKEKSQTNIFTVEDKDYHWGGHKRRYAVIQYNN